MSALNLKIATLLFSYPGFPQHLSTAVASTQRTVGTSFTLLQLPFPHEDFIPYISNFSRASILEFVRPHNEYEAKLRQVFAQHRDHEVLQNPNVNAIPIFDGHKTLLRVKARQTDD